MKLFRTGSLISRLSVNVAVSLGFSCPVFYCPVVLRFFCVKSRKLTIYVKPVPAGCDLLFVFLCFCLCVCIFLRSSWIKIITIQFGQSKFLLRKADVVCFWNVKHILRFFYQDRSYSQNGQPSTIRSTNQLIIPISACHQAKHHSRWCQHIKDTPAGSSICCCWWWWLIIMVTN